MAHRYSARSNPLPQFFRTPAGYATLIGGAAVAAAGVAYLAFKPKEAKAASSQPGVTPGTPATPETPGTATVAWVPIPSLEFSPGARYRFSIPQGGGTNDPMAEAAGLNAYAVALTKNFVIHQTWRAGDIPFDWPADDRGGGRWRFDVTYAGAKPIVVDKSYHLYGAMQAA